MLFWLALKETTKLTPSMNSYVTCYSPSCWESSSMRHKSVNAASRHGPSLLSLAFYFNVCYFVMQENFNPPTERNRLCSLPLFLPAYFHICPLDDGVDTGGRLKFNRGSICVQHTKSVRTFWRFFFLLCVMSKHITVATFNFFIKNKKKRGEKTALRKYFELS